MPDQLFHKTAVVPTSNNLTHTTTCVPPPLLLIEETKASQPTSLSSFRTEQPSLNHNNKTINFISFWRLCYCKWQYPLYTCIIRLWAYNNFQNTTNFSTPSIIMPEEAKVNQPTANDQSEPLETEPLTSTRAITNAENREFMTTILNQMK